MSDMTILRRAAEVLRDKATAATPGPWEGDLGVLAPREAWDLGGGRQCIAHMAMPHQEGRMRANAAYIALMHPPVALALGDWLDDIADYSREIIRELGTDPTALPWVARALAVARAVLREAGE